MDKNLHRSPSGLRNVANPAQGEYSTLLLYLHESRFLFSAKVVLSYIVLIFPGCGSYATNEFNAKGFRKSDFAGDLSIC